MRHGEGRINSSQRELKSWEEKLNAAKDPPKVVQLKGKAKRHWNVKTLAIASPWEIFSFYSVSSRRKNGHDRGSSPPGGCEETRC